MIPAETIEEIKGRLDILNVISSYVPLKKKGRNYLGLCPFHQEKTPSFTVSPEKDLWHCFGCGAGGNAFSFVMKLENLSFVETLKLLGEQVGVVVQDEMTGSYNNKKEKKDILYALVLKASEFFQTQLRGEQGQIAREYLAARGVDEAMLEKFKLGYVPAEWDRLLKQLTQAGYGPELLEQAGLIVKREASPDAGSGRNGSGHYDRFRGRLIFTVTDSRERPIAFGGRILTGGDNEPKYLNSPETAIFNKGKLLYALPQAQKAMREQGIVILTEGYMDTLTCHQFGFENAVATLGTALTTDQAKLLARYVKTVILAYDADQAGQMATERGIDILREANLNVKVAYLKGKDPDDMLRNEGRDAFAKALKDAVPYLRYLLDRNFKNYEISAPEGKNQAAQAAIKILGTVSQDVLRSEYIRYVSEVLKIKEELLVAALNQGRYYNKRQAPKIITPWVRTSSKQAKAGETLLKACLESPEMCSKILAELKVEDLQDSKAQALWQEIQANQEQAGYDWLESVPGDVQKLARRLLLQDEPWHDKIIDDCLKVIKEARSDEKKDVLRQELKNAEAKGDEAKAREVLEALQKSI
ncbi:DNA primase [Candidatus Margulisiibacteriota bacterium]